MRSLPVLSLALASAVLVAACGGSAASPASPASPVSPAASSPPPAAGTPATADDLAGRTFIVTSADGYTIVEGSEIALTFEDSRIGIRAGCNMMGGGVTITDGVLAVGPMMTTEMACDEPLMEQDQWISSFVNGATVTIDGDTITLARDGTTLTATDRTVVHPDRPLEGTTWAVDGLVTNQAVSSMPAGVTATLVFADGRVDVKPGCNTGSGTAEVGETSITFGPIATTKMACEGDAMQVEAHVLQVLQGDVAFDIDADTLTLTGAGGGLTAKAQP